MDTIIEFLSFSDASIVSVTVGAILLTSSSAIVGTFTFLKKKALIGDAVAHSVLPGICLAFLLAGNKNPFALIIGAFATGWISLFIIDKITSLSKIKEDTAIALILSVFFGIGILMLTYIQGSGNAAQSGLDSFLFGRAAALIGRDLWVFGIVSTILILTVALFFKELKLIAFDESFAKSAGLPVKKLELLLTTLTVLAVVTGIQAVGVVLMAAVLITPAAAARFWTNDVYTMTLIAALFGAFSGLMGAFISFTSPSMPTGPWIVMIISLIAMGSFFFAPKRGILSRTLQRNELKRQFMEENLLKAFYHLGESDMVMDQNRTETDIINRRLFPSQGLKRTLKRLDRKGFLNQSSDGWSLTPEGVVRGKRVVKLHRLWELYLSEHMRIAPDHVHEDAETIEHILTPELEQELERLLKNPSLDPHDKQIPT